VIRFRQPWLGLAGLLFVVPVAAVLAFAGGPETAVRVLGPLVGTALTPVAMVAFWWNRWPGTTLRPAWAGWFDTLVIAALALALAVLGQVVVGRADLRGSVVMKARFDRSCRLTVTGSSRCSSSVPSPRRSTAPSPRTPAPGPGRASRARHGRPKRRAR